MAEADYFFSLLQDKQSIRFGCRQKTISMVKPEPSGSLYEFVTEDPSGIVLSAYPAGRVRQMGDGTFTILVEEFSFVTLTLAVELDVRCWLLRDTACLESTGFRITGLDGLADTARFEIGVRGKLKPSPPDSSLCCLTGDIEFEAVGPLPGRLVAAPEPVLRAAARVVSEALARTAANRFTEKVPAAYAAWAKERSKAEA